MSRHSEAWSSTRRLHLFIALVLRSAVGPARLARLYLSLASVQNCEKAWEAIPIFIMRLSNVIILIENCNVFMKEEFLGIFG